MTAAQSDDSDRGLIVGLTQGASSLGRVIGPGVSGTVYQSYGPYAPFQLGAAVLVIAIGAGLYVATRQGPAAPATPH